MAQCVYKELFLCEKMPKNITGKLGCQKFLQNGRRYGVLQKRAMNFCLIGKGSQSSADKYFLVFGRVLDFFDLLKTLLDSFRTF